MWIVFDDLSTIKSVEGTYLHRSREAISYGVECACAMCICTIICSIHHYAHWNAQRLIVLGIRCLCFKYFVLPLFLTICCLWKETFCIFLQVFWCQWGPNWMNYSMRKMSLKPPKVHLFSRASDEVFVPRNKCRAAIYVVGEMLMELFILTIRIHCWDSGP